MSAPTVEDFEDVEDYSNNPSHGGNNLQDHSLPSPEEVKIHSSSFAANSRRMRIILCIVAGVVVMTLAIIIATATKGNKESKSNSLTSTGGSGPQRFWDMTEPEDAVSDTEAALVTIALKGSQDFVDEDGIQFKARERILEDKQIVGKYTYERLAQRYAMYVLYFGMNPDRSWKNNKGWKRLGKDECDWYGVMCDDEGWVERIGLYENGLSGKVPEEVILLPKLKVFNLNRNENMSGHVPSAVCALTTQRVLDIKVDCTAVACSCCGNCEE